MAKNLEKNTTRKEEVNPIVVRTASIRIPYPLILLSAIVLLLYGSSINFGFTELDDTIFINETQAYNADLSNLAHSFQRGVFSDTNDTYYRPLLLDSFVLNHAISGTNVKGYHAMNVLFHLLAVLLLFMLFKRLNLEPWKAFLLTCLFAVHPVLSQAVAWIPGRNDTLLAIFSFAFMIGALDYLRTGKWKFLLLQFACLLGALFTKETAVFVAPAFLLLCITMTEFHWKERKNLLLYATWFVAVLGWFALRSMATIKNDPIQFSTLATNFPIRLSLAVQYLGKIIFPFNLSVFPMLRETTYLFGILAIIALAVMIWFAKGRNTKIILGGVGFFLLLLFPLFVLPSALNDQDFEHRLYMPVIGMLILLSQTVLFKNLNPKQTLYTVIGVCLLFVGINIMHQQKFEDPLTFWTAAVNSTPKSSYANMMLAARLKKTEPAKADELMRKAYEINPKEKYVNYYLGKDFLDKNAIDSSEKYLLAELKTSAYFDTYFLLSRIAFQKNDTAATQRYMEQYLEKDPANGQAINNYILMLTQSGQWKKAMDFITKKESEGIAIPSDLKNMVKQGLVK